MPGTQSVCSFSFVIISCTVWDVMWCKWWSRFQSGISLWSAQAWQVNTIIQNVCWTVCRTMLTALK